MDCVRCRSARAAGRLLSGMASLGVLTGGAVRNAFGQAPEAHHRLPKATSRRCRSRFRISWRERRRTPKSASASPQVITNNLKRSGLFAPIDQAAYIERITNIDARAAIPELEDHQRAGAGDRPHDPAGRRTAEGGVPAVGRRHRPAAHRPAIFHLAGILAADRAHHFRPDLRAPDRRERLFRQPRGVRR